MNRAQQLKLQQQTNQHLINIRQIQLNYYSNLYTVFSIQALFIVASTYDTFSQEKIDYNDYQATTFVSLYYCIFAILVVSGFQVILCTMSLRIYGPGLALYGKLGSMSIAIEGMRLEQNNVIICFMFMMISFAIMTILSFWFTMEFNAALSCTIVMIILSLFWYSSCERIYLRFYWNKEDISWYQANEFILDEHDDEPKLTTSVVDVSDNNNTNTNNNSCDEKINSYDDYKHDNYNINDNDDNFDYVKSRTSNPLHQKNPSIIHINGLNNSTNTTTTITTAPTFTTTNKIKQRKTVSFLSTIYEGIRMSDVNKITPPSSISSSSSISVSSTQNQWAANIMKRSNKTNSFVGTSNNSSDAISNRFVITEGYLSYKCVPSLTGIIIDDDINIISTSSTAKLKRHYFVLLNDRSLYIYKTKLEYKKKTSSPYYRNPLKINEYKIKIQNLDLDNNDNYDNDSSNDYSKTRSTITSDTYRTSTILLSARFQITMIPIENYSTSTTTTSNNDNTNHNHENYNSSDISYDDDDSYYKSVWLLRMDTEDELITWMESIYTVSPNSFNTY